ncbi:hypothetical protein DFJ58DRAFT_857143 [Suillus subalutaceus]|uniref:uncharacterized protein n=1 Tax=Suillus subalutaceus TaxID=48586 RepID=UPI001B876E78|nr:uncharacterized protein DFJ58DRAFT_857143 [Suillus subalutaceus]KAG1868949.1 hypothetical protein DFJ58DRAFT_857143 [Suillus subalutaceus]
MGPPVSIGNNIPPGPPVNIGSGDPYNTGFVTEGAPRHTSSPSPVSPTTTNTFQHIIPDCTIDPALLAISVPPSVTYDASSPVPALVHSPITSTESSDGALTPPAYNDQGKSTGPYGLARVAVGTAALFCGLFGIVRSPNRLADNLLYEEATLAFAGILLDGEALTLSLTGESIGPHGLERVAIAIGAIAVAVFTSSSLGGLLSVAFNLLAC